ncbi:gliding motility-associated C-terminal domain-containing protein [Rufibacter sediminis]|uniref:Gliding motility-associated C-terminal domain-containing protein n=1 Tax=Rufibacter sediminis TaxID=2762756 RepID=A0ABR6VYB8_9BACT|nr:gliding motility-associated C-terminal domain-containing protein [Rufibacter sediminis]MBC3542200.1 gliding motility-associated C-terminal domain-containing protein [Rufibacter sediminis]
MHSFKGYLLIFAIYLYSSSILLGQTTPPPACGAAITPPPQTTVCSGTPLTATPSGTGFFYQWQKDGVNIPNANQPTFPLEESGSYTVIVRGPSCAADTSDAVAMTVNKEEAKFTVDKRERMQPQSADTCGIPVKVTLKNESTPATGVTYAWEITDSSDEAVPTTVAKFIEGTDSTSENPIIQFNLKGQYTIRLRIKGACFDPNNPDGPDDAIDPENPDAESDGRYVHEENVVIVYPQASPQTISECEDLTPGALLTINGSQLIGSQDGKLDYNLGTLRPGSIEWKIVSGTGATISDPTAENPRFTFPKTGSYVVSLVYANECEFSDVLQGPTLINIDFTPRPAKPFLQVEQTSICVGGTYEIAPSRNDFSKAYNFYASETSTTPLNTSGPAPSFFAGPVNSRTVYYITAVENGCESLERSAFTINIIQQDIQNTIGTAQTICADTKPTALTGNDATVGTNRPVYLWERRAVGETDFSPAEGNNTQQSYSPPVLTQTTAYRRTVTFEGCDTPNLSNEIIIEVLPTIQPSENTIEADRELVCRGDAPTFTGNLLSGDIEYLWQSSTTSATTGFVAAAAAQGTDNKNGASFTPAFVSQPTWFRRVAKYRNTNCDFVASAEAILINIEELPQAPIVKAADVSTCQGSSAVLEVLPATGSTFTYVWYTEATGGSPIGSGSPFSTPPLTNDVTFYVEAVSANECVSPRRTAVRVAVAPISANAGRDTTIIQGQSIQLKATGGLTYKWTPTTGLSNPNIANPVATPAGSSADVTTVTYTVTVSSGAGCEATDEVAITIIPRIRVVNTFSPNGDGTNEVWEIENIQNYPEATVEIFNRYGARVFQSNGYSQPWNGTHNGSPLPLATYYYIIRLKKNEKPFTGSITIIK